MFFVFLLLSFGVFVHSLQFTVQKELITSTPPWPYAHVCTLAELNNGDLIATWQAGKSEKDPSSAIWTSMKSLHATKWTNPTVAVRVQKNGSPVCAMNASLYRNATDFLHLSVHVGGGQNGKCLINSWHPYVTEAKSNGQTQGDWQDLRPLTPPAMGAVKNQCVELANGNVLCPSSDETIFFDSSHFGTTDGQFKNWHVSNNITFYEPKTNTLCNSMIQPVILKPKRWQQGEVFALFRTSCDWTAQAKSNDFGKTWPSRAVHSPLVNPGAGIGGTTMESRSDIGWLVGYNNSTKERTPLTVTHSNDDGQTWNHVVDLETGKGQFSYPFVYQSRRDPNKAFVCYTHEPANGIHTIAVATITFK